MHRGAFLLHRKLYGSLFWMARSLHLAIVALVVGALIPSQLLAQAAPVPVVVSVYSLGIDAVSGTGLKGLATYQAAASQTAANARFYTRAVAFSETTIANGAKSRIALGGAVALSAAMLGVGLFLDEITGQIQSAEATPPTPLKAVGPWAHVNFDYLASPYEVWANSGAEACQGMTDGYYHVWSTYVVTCNGYRNTEAVWSYPSSFNGTTQRLAGGTPGVAATDAQIAAAVVADPNSWHELTHNPSGAPRVLGDPMPAQMAAVQTQYRADTGIQLTAGQVEPVPTPSAPPTSNYPTAEPLPDGSLAPPPASASGGQPPEFPAFCTWAQVVCDFVDWVKVDPSVGLLENPTPELPVAAVSSEMVDFQGGLGAGTCPEPIPVIVAGVEEFMSLQSVCDLAAGGRIFVLISATLLAGLMLIRVFA